MGIEDSSTNDPVQKYGSRESDRSTASSGSDNEEPIRKSSSASKEEYAPKNKTKDKDTETLFEKLKKVFSRKAKVSPDSSSFSAVVPHAHGSSKVKSTMIK